MIKGFVKIYREILDWEWYKVSTVKDTFLHCLFKANIEDKKWQGISVKRGQFVTSYAHLAQETGLSIQNVRTAVKKLKKTGELTTKPHGKFTVVTVNNWNRWQEINRKNNNILMATQQTPHPSLSTTKELEESKNTRIEEGAPPACATDSFTKLKPLGEFKNVFLSDEQIQKLLSLTKSQENLNLIIEQLSSNIAGKKKDAQTFDENYPNMHFIALKKYWQQIKKKNSNVIPTGKTTASISSSKSLTELAHELEQEDL